MDWTGVDYLCPVFPWSRKSIKPMLIFIGASAEFV